MYNYSTQLRDKKKETKPRPLVASPRRTKVTGVLVFENSVVNMLDWWVAKAKEQGILEITINEVRSQVLRKTTYKDVYEYLKLYTIAP